MSGTLLGLIALITAGSVGAQPRDPQTYVHLQTADVDSLDPAWAYDSASQNVIFNAYDFLLSFSADDPTRLEPSVATIVPTRESRLISADGLEYRLVIRAGIRFPDGSELMPEDVQYSFLRFLLLDRDAGPSAILLRPLLGRDGTRDTSGKLIPTVYDEATSAVRINGRSIIFRLKHPFAPFPAILARWTPIVSKKWCVEHGEWDGSRDDLARHNNPPRESTALFSRTFGTGPFQVERWDKTTQTVILTRNDGYWRGPAKLKRIVIKTVPDFLLRRLQLAAGDADSIEAAPQYADQLKGLVGVDVIDGLRSFEIGYILFFNLRDPLFADPDVRAGFAYAMDYDAFVGQSLGSPGRRVNGSIPEGLLGYDPTARNRSFSPALALRHFKRAQEGRLWREGFDLPVIVPADNPDADAALEILKNSLAAINPRFRLELQPAQWSVFLERMEQHKAPLALFGSAPEYADPHPLVFGLLHSSGYFPKLFGFHDRRADELIDRAERAQDPRERTELYRELQRIESEDIPYLLIARSNELRVQRSWVHGWRFNPMIPQSPSGAYYWGLTKRAGGLGPASP